MGETGDILIGKLTYQVAIESLYITEVGILRAIFCLEVSTSKKLLANYRNRARYACEMDS
jgi:hypothetical protein